MSEAEIAIIFVGIGAIVVAFFWRISQLNDPTNTTVIRPEQLLQVSNLRPGRCSVRLMRQSGGLYRDLGEFDTTNEAIGAVLASLSRAKIDAIHVRKNDGAQLHVIRMLRNHHGKNEGKTLGGAIISSRMSPGDATVVVVCGSCGVELSERNPAKPSGEYGCAQCDSWAGMVEVKRIAADHVAAGHTNGPTCGCRFQVKTERIT